MKSMVFALVAAAIATAGTAQADPYPPPVLPGPAGGQLPGNQPLPAVCATTMIACGYHYDPDHGAWEQN